jgi:hypothetical protein
VNTCHSDTACPIHAAKNSTIRISPRPNSRSTDRSPERSSWMLRSMDQTRKPSVAAVSTTTVDITHPPADMVPLLSRMTGVGYPGRVVANPGRGLEPVPTVGP